MSEPVMQRLKISREGIILIKSFEGFRPHAVRRDDGRWVIGYGHTLSAREGGVVNEADAELLLQYDLLPVAAALNDSAGVLNQHQFDALASFAFSVGLDRFQSSDVLARLASGSTNEAADAIVGWTDPTPSDTPLRRRAAERALFVADPERPVALAELLSAPLPPPPVIVPFFAADATAIEPQADERSSEASEAPAEPAFGAPSNDLQAVEPAPAFAPVLSGAPASAASAEITPSEPIEYDKGQDAPVQIVATDGSSHETPHPAAIELLAGVGVFSATESLADTAEHAVGERLDHVASDASHVVDHTTLNTSQLAAEAVAGASVALPEATANPPLHAPISLEISQNQASLQRFTPYAGAIVGPLTGLGLASAVAEATTTETVPSPFANDAAATPTLETTVAGAFEPVEASPFQPSITAETPVADGGELLVLTPLDDASVFPTQRLVWPHAEAAVDQDPLFEDDGALRLGAHQMIRNEVVGEEPRRLDWRETGLYILMGGFGLLTFGMSMAAFRRASQPSGGSDFVTIAWVLAVFGFACIAVSAWNLYRKLGRTED